MSHDLLVRTAPSPSIDWRGAILRGYGAFAATIGVLLVWAMIARVDGGVIAPGTIAVQSNVKTVQHLEGGIVAAILKHNGDAVNAGELLLRLDPTRSNSSAELLGRQQVIAMALEARLLAQRDERDGVDYPDHVLQSVADPRILAAVNDNRRQFEARRNSFLSARDVLMKQMEQARFDGDQARSDRFTAQQQLASIGKELPPLRELYERGLVPLPRVMGLERQQQQLEGVVAKSEIDETRAKEKISEIESRREQLRQEYQQEAATALTEVRKILSDLSEQLIVARDTLKRIDVIAPVSGTVQQMRVFTVGGVIKPGDPILDIVPNTDDLVVRGRVSPIDIDRIRTGLQTELRFPQFQAFQSAKAFGVIRDVSKDTIPDEENRNQRSYTIEVEVDRASLPEHLRSKLTAGMVVQVIVPTEARTVLQYLTAPILNRLALSLRER